MAEPEDNYPGSEQSVLSSSKAWAQLIPSDTDNFPFLPKAIKVGDQAGSFVAVGEDNVAATFYASAGEIVPIRPKRINATGLSGGMTFVGLK
jgi:hypothetical protein